MSGTARLRAFYFLYYCNVGVSLPFFAVYLKGLGWTGSQIGAVQMITPLLSAPMALFWAALADQLGAASRALRLATVCSLVSFLALPFVRTPLAMGAVMVAQGLCVPAVVPLVDAVAVEWLKLQKGSGYARTRLFGSLGYVFMAQGLGWVLAWRGDLAGDVLVPGTMLATVAGFALVAQTLPEAPVQMRPKSERGVLALLRDQRLLLLLGVSAIHWGCCAPYHLLFGVFVREQHLSSSVTGLAMASGVIAEVGVLYVAPTLEARYGTRPLLSATFAVTALRWLVLSTLTGPVSIVGLQLLHGFTFGLFWVTVVRALATYVPVQHRATGQALFSAVVFGLGNAVGFQLSGWAADGFGQVAPLFACAAAVELLALVGLLFASGG